jgi:hypothetical protein
MSKQNNNVTVFIALATVLLVSGVIIYWTVFNKNYSWDENYNIKKEQPYASSIFYQLVKASVKSDQFIEIRKHVNEYFHADSLPKQNACYVLLNNESYYDSLEIESLKSFVASGNTCLSITPYINNDLINQLNLAKKDTNEVANTKADRIDAVDSASEDSFSKKEVTAPSTANTNAPDNPSVSSSANSLSMPLLTEWFGSYVLLNFNDPTLQDAKGYVINYFYEQKFQSKWWNYFIPTNFNSTLYTPEVLGYFQDSLPCYIRIKYGKGYFYFHSVPLAFTNYHLLSERNYDYVNKCLSTISYTRIYWDEESKANKFIDNKEQEIDTPLSYILSHRALRYAWYGLLLLLLLFLFFGMKRRQRIIPIYLKKSNSYLDFIESITVLYFQQKDHRNIGLKKWKLLLSFIRNRYGLSTHQIDASFLETLKAKSACSSSLIDSLEKAHLLLENSEHTYTSKDLITLHQLIQYFYQSCK